MSDAPIKKTLSQILDELRGKRSLASREPGGEISIADLDRHIGEVASMLALVAAKVDQISREQTLILDRLDTLGRQMDRPAPPARRKASSARS